MARSGTNHKGGRPKGTNAILAEKMRAELTKRVNEEFTPIINAQIDEAKGLWYEEITKDGQKRIYQKEPNSKSAEYLLNQSIGRPQESIQLSGPEGQPINIRIVNTMKKVYGSE